MDSNGRYIYVKDGDSIWNPMWKPTCTELDKYECRQGLGYTKISGVKNGLEVSVLYFIPKDGRNEIWHVEVKNNTEEKKDVRIWGFIEWCLWDALDDMTNFQRNYSIGEVEIEKGTIFHKTEYRERRNHYAYFSTDAETSGYDTTLDAFVGIHNGLGNPKVISKGECTQSHAHGWLPVGVHQIDLELEPNESETFNFLLGYAENPDDNKFNEDRTIVKSEFAQVKQKFSSDSVILDSFNDLKEYWSKLLSSYQVKTPDPIVNRMVNIWNQYQCMVTFNMSRSASLFESGIGRGMGYRDSNQDILGFVHIIPSRARERILDIAATQLSDGSCYHQYQPLTKKGNSDAGSGFNDDPLWLLLSTAAYIKESGDSSILSEEIGFADLEDSKATLLDHLKISIDYTMNNRGPHGLPLIGHADWNDCLNLNCFSTQPGESFQLAGHGEKGDVAESVMIAGLFCKACEEMAGILRNENNSQKADKYLSKADEMRKVIYDQAWDGDWFLRAYDANGDKVGSKECEEGKIFIESQGWSILGGAGFNNGYAEKSLNSVKEHLATNNGIILQQPAYSKYYVNLGEVSSYPPGYKENAGIFTHNNTWIQIAETLLGRGEQAMEYYKSICPSNKEDQIDTYRAEPYVYSQMTSGKNAPTPGEGKNSWLTGTAAWSFVSISQYILGIRAEHHGFVIDPCIPKSWDKFEVVRKFRGVTYNITILNPDNINKGVENLSIDGKVFKGNTVHFENNKSEYDISVTLGLLN